MIPASLRRFQPYFKYLRPVRLYFLSSVACAALYGFIYGVVLNYVLMKKVFPAIFSSHTRDMSHWQVIGYAALIPAVFLVRALAYYFNSYLINLCGVRVLEQIRVDFFRKLQVLPMSFFARQKTGDLLARGLGDTMQLQFTLTNVANDIFMQPFTLIGAIGYLIYAAAHNQSIWFVLLCLCSIPVAVFPIRYVGKHILHRMQQTQAQIGSVTNNMSENLGAVREVRAFNLEDREVGRFEDAVRSLVHVQMKVVKYSTMLSPSIEVISALGVAGTLIYAYYARIAWNDFLSIVLALFIAYDPIKKLGTVWTNLKRGLSSVERLEVVLNAPVDIQDPPHPVDVGHLRGAIAFKNVNFAYNPGEPVLRDLSIAIPAGTSCALVGPSGSGKTTFINLVPRFYEVGAGGITIDGIDIRSMRLADLRNNIALVSQDPVLFNDTIFNNLMLGRQDATKDEVMAAAIDAYADDYIRELPRGYETIVGERGVLLSGGQKQRVAIARAFLRNAPILILDEATSALDSESEAAIQEALKKLVVGKTVLTIAHRFSTIRNASMILVFNGGEIVATGDHARLYGANALYRSLYDRQAAGRQPVA